MDWNLLLGIFGVVLTIVFGILSFKKSKYPGRILFVNLNTVNLFDSLINNFNDIKVSFQGHAICKNLIFFRGAFVNDGMMDIPSNHISLVLPEKCKWIDFKTTSSSDGMSCSVQVENDRESTLSFDQMKKKEFIVYEGLIETEDEQTPKKVIDSIEFKHRILNTAKISGPCRMDVPRSTSKRYIHRLLVYSSLMTFMLLAQIFYMVQNQGSPVFYCNQVDDSAIYSANINDENKIVLTDLKDEIFIPSFLRTRKIVSIEKFKEEYYISEEPYRGHVWTVYSMAILFFISSVLMWLICIIDIGEFKTRKKILRLLGEEQ